MGRSTSDPGRARAVRVIQNSTTIGTTNANEHMAPKMPPMATAWGPNASTPNTAPLTAAAKSTPNTTRSGHSAWRTLRRRSPRIKQLRPVMRTSGLPRSPSSSPPSETATSQPPQPPSTANSHGNAPPGASFALQIVSTFHTTHRRGGYSRWRAATEAASLINTACGTLVPSYIGTT